jgi:monoamine oxidase
MTLIEKPIAVIGAGLSGLYAAWQLAAAGQRVQLIEARSRIGGRILSERLPGQTHRPDLGPSWYWPEMNPRMAALVQELALTDYPQYSSGASMREEVDGTVRRIRSSWFPQPESRRLVGGMQSLVEALLARMGSVQIQLDSVVKHIELMPNGLSLRVEQADELKTMQVAAGNP